MFVIFEENMITLKEARSIFKHGRRCPTMKTLHRWCGVGLFNRHTQKQVKLQSVIEGGLQYTSTEAITRFRAALNETFMTWDEL